MPHGQLVIARVAQDVSESQEGAALRLDRISSSSPTPSPRIRRGGGRTSGVVRARQETTWLRTSSVSKLRACCMISSGGNCAILFTYACPARGLVSAAGSHAGKENREGVWTSGHANLIEDL